MFSFLIVLFLGVALGYFLTLVDAPYKEETAKVSDSNQTNWRNSHKPVLHVVDERPGFSLAEAPSYRPHYLIAPVIEQTQDRYQLPPGATDSPPPESAAIVAVILFFIREDPSIGITKLEQYVVMLDNLCFQSLGHRLFAYRLLKGPYGYYIRNFRAFLDFIEQKGFISKQKIYFDHERYRYLFTTLHKVPKEIFPEPLLSWLRYILEEWRGVSADQTKEDAEKQITPAALKAFMALPSLGS